MVKEDKVLIKINLRNNSYYKKLGYDTTSKEILVSVLDLTKGTKIRVTAICEICLSENNIQYNKYCINRERNNKGYYSCFCCKNIEKEKTCIVKYGVKSYSMTDEFRVSESIKWKGIQKGSEKGKITMLEKYGVDSYFKTEESRNTNRIWMSSDEFKEKSKETLLCKYGVDSYSKTVQFKNDLYSKRELILEKIKKTFLEKYGVDWISKTELWKDKYSSKLSQTTKKIKITCMRKYGVDNVSKDVTIKSKIRKTKIDTGLIIPDILLTDWMIYKKLVRNITKRNKIELYENWNGCDYYDGESIKSYLSFTHVHRFYPTIDHKISVFFGFINDISCEEIGSINNLCITKRYINSTKSRLIEEEFIKSKKL